MDIRFLISRFLRQVHWFALVVLVFAGAGVIAVRAMPTVYVAEALLVVESEQIPDALAQSTVQTQTGEQLQIIEQRILSRDNLLAVANQLKIFEGVEAKRDKPMTAGEIVEDLRSRVVIQPRYDRGPNGNVDATLVEVRFEADTPTMAAAVANALVTMILEEDVAMRTVVARQTREFFQQEVERLEQLMAERSAAILAFKEKNIAALPDSLEFRREEMAQVAARLDEMERQRQVLLDQVDRLARLRGGSVGSSGDGAADGAADVPAESGQVTTRDFRRDDLSAQLGFLDEEQVRLEARVLDLSKTIAQTPGNAVQLEALERDYENVRSQYDQAVENRAKAETGETIEALSKGERITVIEQAVAPDKPAKPNRPKILAAGVGVGMMAGIALVAVLEFLRGAIRRPQDLVGALGITPIASLPYVVTANERQRWRIGMTLGVLWLLALAISVLWFVNEHVMPLDLVAQKLRARLTPWMGS